MGLRINTNELAIVAQRRLEENTRDLAGTVERLSTGSRIVHASDDAAGLAISDNLNAQARSLGQAIRNSQQGLSLVQVYESGTNETNNILLRLRELAMTSATDTLGDKERSLVDNEVQQLTQEMTRIAHATKFGGRELLSGESVDLQFQVGINNDPETDRIRFNPGSTDLTANGLGVGGMTVKTRDDAQGSLETIDEALNKVNENRARIGATQERLNSTINAQTVYQENVLSAKSYIRDADIAVETANLAKQQILRSAGAAVLAQANDAPKLALQLLRF